MTRQCRGQRARGDGAARQQPAAAAGNEQEIERAGLFEQLDGRRALAGDDVGVIVGRNHDEAALVRDAAAQRFAIVALAVVEDDLAAVSFGRLALDRRGVGRHDDDARDVEQLPGERDRLRVIAGGKGEDAARRSAAESRESAL